MSLPSLDPKQCPLCGDPNQCGMAAGSEQCWCFVTTIPEAVLASLPEEARGVACVCRKCAEGTAPRERKLAVRS